MSVAVLAALTGVLGVVIGRLWDTRSESARWQRDQKTASYQRFAEEFRVTAEGIRTVALADPTVDGFGDLVDRVRTNAHSWDNAYSAVWLHGSATVVTAAAVLDRAQTELFYDAQERLFTLEDWYVTRAPMRAAFEKFIEFVRDELDLEYVSATYFPAVARQLPSSEREQLS